MNDSILVDTFALGGMVHVQRKRASANSESVLVSCRGRYVSGQYHGCNAGSEGGGCFVCSSTNVMVRRSMIAFSMPDDVPPVDPKKIYCGIIAVGGGRYVGWAAFGDEYRNGPASHEPVLAHQFALDLASDILTDRYVEPWTEQENRRRWDYATHGVSNGVSFARDGFTGYVGWAEWYPIKIGGLVRATYDEAKRDSFTLADALVTDVVAKRAAEDERLTAERKANRQAELEAAQAALTNAQDDFVKAKLLVDPNGETFSSAVDSLSTASNGIGWARAKYGRLLNHAAQCEDRYRDQCIEQAAQWLLLIDASIALADAALAVVHLERRALVS